MLISLLINIAPIREIDLKKWVVLRFDQNLEAIKAK